MDFELQNLAKLKKLEETLTALVDKIDREIIQTDVEWLHLKSVSEKLNSTEVEAPVPTNSVSETNPNRNTSAKVKMEFTDEVFVNTSQLELCPQRTVMIQNSEEFDSD
ncbi:hypothetical protein JTB14_002645 [Gonioctena quinquepunctata]|nr:hypothetical protein JTB14_002645 [Gonioctena quinquepunctata]